MNISLLYWILMLFLAVFGVWTNRTDWRSGSPGLIVYILLGLLGWKVFGPALHG